MIFIIRSFCNDQSNHSILFYIFPSNKNKNDPLKFIFKIKTNLVFWSKFNWNWVVGMQSIGYYRRFYKWKHLLLNITLFFFFLIFGGWSGGFLEKSVHDIQSFHQQLILIFWIAFAISSIVTQPSFFLSRKLNKTFLPKST